MSDSTNRSSEQIKRERVPTEQLFAGARYLDGACNDVNDAFLLCKENSLDPAVCRAQAEAVLSCSLKLYVCTAFLFWRRLSSA
jgi:hypothetical protein